MTRNLRPAVRFGQSFTDQELNREVTLTAMPFRDCESESRTPDIGLLEMSAFKSRQVWVRTRAMFGIARLPEIRGNPALLCQEFWNPKGILSFSPGLRGRPVRLGPSYPGSPPAAVVSTSKRLRPDRLPAPQHPAAARCFWDFRQALTGFIPPGDTTPFPTKRRKFSSNPVASTVAFVFVCKPAQLR